MYSLYLTCNPGDVDTLSADLWAFGTAGIRELESGEHTLLIAGFETNVQRLELVQHFASYSPAWEQEDATDWVEHTQGAWPPREVGERILLAPPWSQVPTPNGRVRVVHNPGLACGTGEHPCTQLALTAIEQHVTSGSAVADIGTGSAILAIASVRLGARIAIGVDPDEASLAAAKENFQLNGLPPSLAAGSAECLRTESADLVIANISGTVLMDIMDDLLRIVKPGGTLILTGFPESELAVFQRLFPQAETTGLNEWRCVTSLIGSPRTALRG